MRWMRGVWGLIIAISIVTLALIAFVGLFWIMEILPLVAFVGTIIVYGVLSGRPSPQAARKAHVKELEERS